MLTLPLRNSGAQFLHQTPPFSPLFLWKRSLQTLLNSIYNYPTVTYPCLSHHPNPEISQFCGKGFAQITNELTGKALHCLCIKGLIPFSIFRSNTLINMYVQCGHVDHAYKVFDEMPQRNEVSWNTIISGHAKFGSFEEGVRLFFEMRREDFGSNGFVIASLIKACSRVGDVISELRQFHGFVVKSGLLTDVFVATSLLHLYGTNSFLVEATKVFETMTYKNTVSMTSLMAGYSDHGQPREVIDLYQQMREEASAFTENAFAVVIRSCGVLQDIILGLQVLGHVIKSGFELRVSVMNSLMSMFDNVGLLKDASYVFDHMNERDTISWNSIIKAFGNHKLTDKAFKYFSLMRFANKEVNSNAVSSLILACASIDNLKWGRGIHGLLFKFGIDSDVCVCNTLISMYSGAGELYDAKFLFCTMPRKDIISWNSMLKCYAQNGQCTYVLQVLTSLLKTRLSVNHVSMATTLAACSNAELFPETTIIHGLAVVFGLANNLVVTNSLITVYAKFGLMVKAKQVFDLMPKQDIVTWNAVVGGYAENEAADEALTTFELMRRRGILPNYITIVNLLSSFSNPRSLSTHGRPLHAHVLQTGFDSYEYVNNSLITTYAKCGDLDASSRLFSESVNITSTTYNALISANARHGREAEALKLFVEMCNSGVYLDQFSFSSAFAAASNLAANYEGRMLHGLTVKLGFNLNMHVINAAMDMYGKCGELDGVLRIIPEPGSRSLHCWNILISIYARHGLFQQARETFNEMLDARFKPDYITFVSLLSACSREGLVDEGIKIYSSMTTEHKISPRIEHCACMIDLLGRSGRFTEAEKFLQEMPVPPNGFIWRCLLAACRTHGNLELGKRAAEELIQVGPDDDSAYVLYSNICASTGNWEDVENVRNQMLLVNVTKKPACSLGQA